MPLVPLEHAKLYFTKTGNGERTLIAFHGFGQNGHVFTELAASLSSAYTLYLVDIFFHGTSEWNNGEQPLEKKFWNRILEKFLDEQSISSFSVLGFSMGSKFALATLEGFPNRVKEIFLLAPDGIKTNTWYRLATYPFVLRKLFKSMIKNPQRFHAIASFVFRLGLLDKSMLRFTESQMNTEEKRKRVYYSWVVFRHLTFNNGKIAKIINQHSIRLVLIVGKYDTIITANHTTNLTRHVNSFQLEVPEVNHNNIIRAAATLLNRLS